MKTNPARRWDSQIETETRKLRETKTINLLTSQTGKVVGLRLDCTDREFSIQCVEDAMYANEHNQTSGQRWLEQGIVFKDLGENPQTQRRTTVSHNG